MRRWPSPPRHILRQNDGPATFFVLAPDAGGRLSLQVPDDDTRFHGRLGNGSPPSLSRATPSAVSVHSSELIGCPISRSLTTCCVCPELRPLPSPGVTRLQRYCEPLRHPGAPDLSLAGVRLVIADHASGLPVLRTPSLCTCCRHYPGAAAGRIIRSLPPAVSAFPERVVGSACASSFSRSHEAMIATGILAE